MRSLHQTWAWVAVAVAGVVGLWGVFLAWRQKEPGRPFWVGVGAAAVTMLGQVVLGVYLIGGEGLSAGDQHVFYGFLIAFIFAFAYIYRSTMARKPALYYGAMLLFIMGLGLRSITNWNLDF